ncbi:MAG: hypothetical protein ACE5GD_02310 [Candidatus Geothermarchaeales archaeon]
MRRLFGTAGIRGVFNRDLDSNLTLKVALAVSKDDERGRVAVARDGRFGSQAMKYVLESGFLSSGWDVLDVGVCPTPILAFATKEYDCNYGVMMTASHNPPEYVGMKIFDGDGMEIPEEKEVEIQRRTEEGDLPRGMWSRIGRSIQGEGAEQHYIKKLLEELPEEGKRSLNILVDCSNGPVTTPISSILSNLGHRILLYNSHCDGCFPGRRPEPTPKNLEKTARLVRDLGLDLGIAFDGDGDRVSLIDERGRFISVHTVAATYVKRRLEEQFNKKVVVSIDTSRAVEEVVNQAGGEVFWSRLGKTFVRVKDLGGAIGSEPWKIVDVDWGLWEDGLFEAAKIVSWMSQTSLKASEFFGQVPEYPQVRWSRSTESRLEAEETMRKIVEKMRPKAQRVITIDGVKMEFDERTWLLVRTSGTENKIRVYVEAETEEKLSKITEELSQLNNGKVGWET